MNKVSCQLCFGEGKAVSSFGARQSGDMSPAWRRAVRWWGWRRVLGKLGIPQLGGCQLHLQILRTYEGVLCVITHDGDPEGHYLGIKRRENSRS